MRCPQCGALVQDDLDRCPTCNSALEIQSSIESAAWCKSCGSSIPSGSKTCPVCGLPVEGAFDDDWGEGESEQSVADGLVEGPVLQSAIPPRPEPGQEEEEHDDAPTRMRLVVATTLAALALVGGTTLFITRPWNPDAYKTHATEDADTSMEGFPGTITHLSAQDQIEDAERTEYLRNAEESIDAFLPYMTEVGDKCAALEGPTEAYTETGTMEERIDYLSEVSEMRDKYEEELQKISDYDMRGSDHATLYERLKVCAGYLKGRLEAFCYVWETIDGAKNPTEALTQTRAAIKNGYDGRSLEEWRNLYENARAGLESEVSK